MWFFTFLIKIVSVGQKAHRIPRKKTKQKKKTSHSKLSLYVGCEVRVTGLKTESTVASQPASIGATYQRIPLGKG